MGSRPAERSSTCGTISPFASTVDLHGGSTTRSGRSKGGATRGTETYWGDKPAVNVGESVVVLYDPERPALCALWTLPDARTS